MQLLHRPRGLRSSACRWLPLVSLSIVLTACQTVSRESVPPFREAVSETAQQTEQSFADVNSFVRERQILRAVEAETLDEELFVTLLPAESVAEWSQAFSLIERYAALVEELTAPDQRAGVEAELRELGKVIVQKADSEVPKAAQAAFTTMGGFLAQQWAGNRGLDAVRQADGVVQPVFKTMAEAIGERHDTGIRGQIRIGWAETLGEFQVSFLTADKGARLNIVKKFVAALDAREAFDQQLRGLRSGILTLARMHADLARGSKADWSSTIKMLREEHKALREEIKLLKEQASK